MYIISNTHNVLYIIIKQYLHNILHNKQLYYAMYVTFIHTHVMCITKYF